MSSQSQQSSSQSQRLGGIDIERKANEVTHFLLVWEQRKIPVKRVDINKHVLKDHKALYSDILKKAEKKLEQVFGLKLVEIGDGSKKAYILVSLLDHTATEELMGWKETKKRGLLLMILALIFMSGNQILDGALWNALKKLGIEKDKPHPVFGDVKKLIMQEFSRQLYLDVTKLPNCDPPQFKFCWGLRAQHETTKRKILEFVTELTETLGETKERYLYYRAIVVVMFGVLLVPYVTFYDTKGGELYYSN